MKNKVKFTLTPLFFSLFLISVNCGNDKDDTKNTIISYAGSMPVGDFIVIQINRESSLVRRINYTPDPDEDSGWLAYFSVPADDENAEGFSIIKRVELTGGHYVLFAERADTALVYQEFDSTHNPAGWPSFVILRERVDRSQYYEKAYNWMRFRIEEIPTTNSAMEAGFAAFDSESNFGIMYGAGYRSAEPPGDCIGDINDSADTSRVDNFTYNTELTANTMWTGAESDMNAAVNLAGTASGSNMIDFGQSVGDGGSGLAVPQSDVTLTEAEGTYLLMCYENNQTTHTNTVEPMKLVISGSGMHLKLYVYSQNTITELPVFTASLKPVAALTAAESPGGAVAIINQYAATSGNIGAHSETVRNAHMCRGSFFAQDSDCIINIIFDPDGLFCGFTMSDTESDEIIRFGFGIKDTEYRNL
ncbi:MAG: hypothetical protein JW864_15010 [Spirochaetes bacterium]|nr:hypothetical protein [Spirochaetota bacterium]